MKHTLGPCPFCGSPPMQDGYDRFDENNKRIGYQAVIRCPNKACAAQPGVSGSSVDFADLVLAWNRRALAVQRHMEEVPQPGLPQHLQAVLDAAPANVTRRTGAALITRHMFTVSHRSLEAWPLPTQHVNGKAIIPTDKLFAVAYAKLIAAPVTPPQQRLAMQQHVKEEQTMSLPILASGRLDPIIQFFDYRHLPAELQLVSAAFKVLADKLIDDLPDNAQRQVALQKLLEAKDAAVRAKIMQ